MSEINYFGSRISEAFRDRIARDFPIGSIVTSGSGTPDRDDEMLVCTLYYKEITMNCAFYFNGYTMRPKKVVLWMEEKYASSIELLLWTNRYNQKYAPASCAVARATKDGQYEAEIIFTLTRYETADKIRSARLEKYFKLAAAHFLILSSLTADTGTEAAPEGTPIAYKLWNPEDDCGAPDCDEKKASDKK